jgi:hypothetical protein
MANMTVTCPNCSEKIPLHSELAVEPIPPQSFEKFTREAARALEIACGSDDLHLVAVNCTEAICHELAALREAMTPPQITLDPPHITDPIGEKWDARVSDGKEGGESDPVAFTAEPVPELVTLSEMIAGEQAAERAAVLKELFALRDRLVALVGHAGTEPMQETINRIEAGDHRKDGE